MPSAAPAGIRTSRRARDNPFRVDRVLTVRYRLQRTTWARLLTRLRELSFRAAICGPQGAGKTTLLEDLAVRLQDAGFATSLLRLCRETRRDAARLLREFQSVAGRGEILLVDGVEQLGPWLWRRLRRDSLRHAGLIVTSHSAGRLPTLIDCRTDPVLLESIVAELVPGDIDELRPHLPALFAAHQGNLRNCLRALFDAYAGNSDSFTPSAEDLS